MKRIVAEKWEWMMFSDGPFYRDVIPDIEGHHRAVICGDVVAKSLGIRKKKNLPDRILLEASLRPIKGAVKFVAGKSLGKYDEVAICYAEGPKRRLGGYAMAQRALLEMVGEGRFYHPTETFAFYLRISTLPSKKPTL